MAFATGNPRGIAHEINVTPLIDVLLVLLIIFMCITPVSPHGLSALVPQPPRDAHAPPERTIVLELAAGSGGPTTYRINGTVVPKSELEQSLAAIFAARAERVMFIRGDASLNFSDIAEAVAIGRAAGVDNIGLMTPASTPGQ